MKFYLKNIAMLTAFLAIICLPFLVRADYSPEPILFDPGSNVQQETQLGNKSPVETTSNIINWALGVLGLFTVALMIYAGFIWMYARGNEEEAAKAKKILEGAVIGLIIILTSYGVAAWVFDAMIDATQQ